MTSEYEEICCSTCYKPPAKFVCIGCKLAFCRKDFKEHEQQLLTRFDSEIVQSHDELMDRIHKLDTSKYSTTDLFDRIDQWMKASIKMVQLAAERARHQLNELIERHKKIIAERLESITKKIRCIREEESVLEDDIDRTKTLMVALEKRVQLFTDENKRNRLIFEDRSTDWNRLLFVYDPLQNNSSSRIGNISFDTKWSQYGVTIGGGNGPGDALSQLYYPLGICVTDDRSVYVAEYFNHRVVEWKPGESNARVVAGGFGQGNSANQLNSPTGIVMDKKGDCLIICDLGNARIVRWPIKSGKCGETILSNIASYGLAIDEEDNLYVSDFDQHVVRKYRMGESKGVVVAGGNGQGNRLDQLNNISFVAVDQNGSVYVTDWGNHRVVKWKVGAKSGIVVAGNRGQGNTLSQLAYPGGIFISQHGTVFIADQGNNRVMRWLPSANEGTIIVGGSTCGNEPNQFSSPQDIAFDNEGNFYVTDTKNHRIQKFNVVKYQ